MSSSTAAILALVCWVGRIRRRNPDEGTELRVVVDFGLETLAEFPEVGAVVLSHEGGSLCDHLKVLSWRVIVQELYDTRESQPRDKLEFHKICYVRQAVCRYAGV